MQNQKGNIVLIIAGIVAVAILAGGVVYFVAKKPAQKEEPKPQTQTYQQPEVKDETADASAIASATADWKTYRNEKYGFEVKYPEEWYYIEQEYNPLSDFVYQLSLTNNEELKLNPALLDTPNRKAPASELAYSMCGLGRCQKQNLNL